MEWSATDTNRESQEARLAAAIAAIDARLAAQCEAIMTAPAFVELASLWHAIQWLAGIAADTQDGCVEILQVRPQEYLVSPTSGSPPGSRLFSKLFHDKLAILGGDGVGLLIVASPLEGDDPDLPLQIRTLGSIGERVHCPVLFSAAPSLIGFENFDALETLGQLKARQSQNGPQNWRSAVFGPVAAAGGRPQPMDSLFNYVGVCLPDILMIPADPMPIGNGPLLARPAIWAGGAFAAAALALRTQDETGLFISMIGATPLDWPYPAGVIADLMISRVITEPCGLAVPPPVRAALSAGMAAQLEELGFCVVRSEGVGAEALISSLPSLGALTATQGAARQSFDRRYHQLNILMSVSRIAHGVARLGRTMIGRSMTPEQAQAHLQAWLLQFCNDRVDLTVEEKLHRPLKTAKAEIKPVIGRPGEFACTLTIAPHARFDDPIEVTMTAELGRAA